eukprot:10589035-Alexandrium_andersonii.AAC.1
MAQAEQTIRQAVEPTCRPWRLTIKCPGASVPASLRACVLACLRAVLACFRACVLACLCACVP